MPSLETENALKIERRTPCARSSDYLYLVLYGIVFAALNWAALPWGGAGFFSLWYPAAGLRFAVLWHRGRHLTPLLIIAELVADTCTGIIAPSGPDVYAAIAGAMRPGLSYGLAIFAVRRISSTRDGVLSLPPMTLGIAAITAPALNALMVVLLPGFGYFKIGVDLIISLTSLSVGDLLGILVVAPLILWCGAVGRREHRPQFHFAEWQIILEDCLIVVAAIMLTWGLWRAGLGSQFAPGLLAGAWIGLRHGRVAAWFAIIAQIIVYLPYSAGLAGDVQRLQFHLDIATIVVVTWLAGSLSDAQDEATINLERRNRLLFQAERLKTLRAMSVAVIHEISQPLSTIAIEAGHLAKATEKLEPDIADSAALVNLKAQSLSTLIRRLRKFGGREVDYPSPIPLAAVVQSATDIVSAEIRTTQNSIVTGDFPGDLYVQAHEIELTQAVVNLLRNAVAASPGRQINIECFSRGDEASILVRNPTVRKPVTPPTQGMGVGLAIARTIVEAHGGTLVREDSLQSTHFVISLPQLAGGAA